jgi:uroporphyrinogen-III synthase
MFPLLQTEPEDLGTLQELTAAIAADPPRYLLANTGYGMRTWLGLAAQWGLQGPLVGSLRGRTDIAARGAKALGELRKVGLDAWYKAPGETLDEVVDRLAHEDLTGASIVFQMHGEQSEEAVGRLVQAGATVTCLPVYRMGQGGEAAAQALAQAVIDGTTDAVTFTAAPQVQALFRAARADDLAPRVLDAFNSGGVAAVCIGEVCAGAARAEGITGPLVPPHPRLGSLATALAAHLSGRRMVLAGQHGPVTVSGRLVGVGGDDVSLGPVEQRALRRLARQRSAVEIQTLGDLSAGHLSALAQALDGALEISGSHCRLLWAGP